MLLAYLLYRAGKLQGMEKMRTSNMTHRAPLRFTSFVVLAMMVVAGPVHATIVDAIGCGAVAPPEQIATTATTTVRSQELSTPLCYAYTSSMGGIGYANGMASAAMNAPDYLFGNLSAESSVGFNEQVRATIFWDGTPATDFGFLTGVASFRASADLLASGTGAHSSAFAQYSLSLGGLQAAGVQEASNLNPFYEAGSWGIVDLGLVQFFPNEVFTLSGSATLRASALKGYGQAAQTHATADFSHTLQWLGIGGLQAYDVSGNAMTMPDNLRFSLLGMSSGFDYVYAAPNPFGGMATSVPEPATGALMLLGGLMALAMRKRRGLTPQAQCRTAAVAR
jgi:hypothetical protein